MSKDNPNDTSDRDSHYATLRRQVRDAKRERGEIPTPQPQKRRKSNADWTPPPIAPDQVFLYGLHTVRAALNNPERKPIKLSLTQNALVRLEIGPVDALPFPVEIVTPQDLDKHLGPEAIHQGVMLETRPLPPRRLEALKESPLLLVLDQVTDPHNVGAIMRTAVAFGAGAVITTMRHSPTESGVLAKSASGALELIPYIQITNLAEALGELHKLGFVSIGLDSEGPRPLEETFSGDKLALVLGSEGKGLRQKTRDTVNALARLDMPGEIKSLNVSNAAAIALYASRQFLLRQS
ncbi:MULTISPECIES: 23S rRNA (guanosine(2251)-2'-O)-methyltransferase RlmB [Rhizobium/Agrobacterium group]|uniref:tRNA/rRNA metyltransferase n=2 Tax=Rhizobium/Agrobacterium group TaxID=227290 RepID=B9JVL7_ALLAM|nr:MULTISPECIES: 23S rRNA (guanosine(2251)-2'-O)-methyltransferase RlmB [Rhizobium/Agrobacterium group]ACM36297.1 tRNA/rRNA metyltransferase [Allorhizobium ampelinum S4]MCF1434153.1 23S rRNA (guanosine(2251)-2'-O)-methyltransferase RlmB [Allorhizobium ampelinum]MCF1449169.1 23S rRNA (guanosine(2251)-2'-O)-methyltransferase RlmB [Allorhizobium ampelinum]MCF1474575.1 23S rRNA (guanosine(2251)-2'-O)-methyltransferase RlmB [Allorhizobium ampelinum]MCF1494915.1 23S rRNA (guanosine(2251)-2'-O)-methy